MSENSRDSEEAKGEDLQAIQRELEGERKRNAELLTRLKYAQADLENFRKRMDKEVREAAESQARSLVGKLLVVQDELELAVRHGRAGTEEGKMIEGLAMVQRNLLSALQSAGVEKIEALGVPFDPAVHEAVARVQGRAPGEDMVVEEIRTGYIFRGQVLRPSMVKVELASKTASEEAKVNE